MSAFGRRGGGPGQRPSFGVARPMKGGPGGAAPVPAPEDGGEQFPPLESLPISDDGAPLEPAPGDAMSRLDDRMALSGGRKSVVEGKRVKVRVGPGGSRRIKYNNKI